MSSTSKRLTLTPDDYEAARLLKSIGLKNYLGVTRNLDDRVTDIAFNERDKSTINTELFVAFVPTATQVPFFNSFARMYCQTIHDGSTSGGDAYQVCHTLNSIVDQGAIYYDANGPVGRVIQMPCSFRLFNRLRNECKFYGEVFNTTVALDAYLSRNGFVLTDPTGVDQLPDDPQTGNGPTVGVPVRGP